MLTCQFPHLLLSSPMRCPRHVRRRLHRRISRIELSHRLTLPCRLRLSLLRPSHSVHRRILLTSDLVLCSRRPQCRLILILITYRLARCRRCIHALLCLTRPSLSNPRLHNCTRPRSRCCLHRSRHQCHTLPLSLPRTYCLCHPATGLARVRRLRRCRRLCAVVIFSSLQSPSPARRLHPCSLPRRLLRPLPGCRRHRRW